MSVWTVLLAGSGLLLLLGYLQFRWRYRHILAAASQLPSPPTLPLIGNTLYFLGGIPSITRTILRLSRQFKELFVIWIGPVPLFVISTPEDVKIVLSSSNTLERDDIYQFLKPYLGNGILTAPVPIWRKYRRLFNTILHPTNVEKFVPLFNDLSRDLVVEIENQGNLLDPKEVIFHTTLAGVIKTVLNPNSVISKELKAAVLFLFNKIGELFMRRLYQIWLHPDWIYNLVCRKEVKESFRELQVARDIIESFLSVLPPDLDCTDLGGEGNAIRLRHLMQNNPPDPNEDHDWRDEIQTVIVGGSDTLVSALSFLLFSLANHPLVQAKVYAEMERVMVDLSGDVTAADCNNMSYLEQAILESIRVHGVFPNILRKATRDTKLSTGTLPTGSRIMIALHAMGWNSEVFPEPERFLPERFSAENSSARSPYAFVPFSGGPRNCGGKTYSMLFLKIMVVHILRKYRIRTKIKMEDVEYEIKVIIFSKQPLMMEFLPRDQLNA